MGRKRGTHKENICVQINKDSELKTYISTFSADLLTMFTVYTHIDTK